MKILITGGAGFIGSHLCKRLINEGHEVVCVDNFYTGKKVNLFEINDNKNFLLHEHDVNEPLDIQVDQIYNLACPASPRSYQERPIETTKTSVLGALNMLELARQLNIPILQASTSEVYGDPEVHPQHEDYKGHVNVLSPRACYDEGKRCAETLFMDYHRQHGTDIRIVRIFNTYGPNMYKDDGRVVSNFIVQALKHEPITVYGDGSQTRSFQYIDDCVEAMTRMMAAKDFIGPVNIGNPTETSIKDLAEKIIKLAHSTSEIVYKDLPQDDPQKRNPNIELAKQKLDWEPQVSLEDGLNRTINYFREIIQ